MNKASGTAQPAANAAMSTAIRMAAWIASFGTAIHLAAIAGGPQWYAFFGAPPSIVASAHAGTWVAPAGAAGIAALMAICAAYALSAAGTIRPLPAPRLALGGIAFICLFRALVLLPLAVWRPALLTPFEIIAALVWGLAGIGFVAAFATVRRLHRARGMPANDFRPE